MNKDSLGHTFELKQSIEQEINEEVWSIASLESIISQVIEIFTTHFFQSESEQSNNRDWAKEAFDYISAHYRDYISLINVAEHLQLNPNYLNRVFKRKYKVSIPDFILNLRMDEACTYIKSFPYALIKEVSEHVGFTDPYYFSKVFKAHTGYTPSEYKQQALTS